MRTGTDAGAVARAAAGAATCSTARRCTSPPGRSTTRVRCRSRCSRTRSAAPSWCCASSTRARGCAWSKEHRVTNTFTAPTQLKRIVTPAAGRARARRPVVDAHADRQRRTGAVLAEAGGHREARRRLPLRGLRLHRARRRHRAPARGPAAQAGLVRQDLRPDRGAHRRRRRHRRADGRAGRAVHPHDARDGRLPPHRRAAHRSTTAASGSRSATSRTSTTRATSTSATARRT